MELNEKLSQAVWIARTLFDRGKTSGTTANMSFRHNQDLYITCSGSCFGTLRASDFVRFSPQGEVGTNPASKRPSKELDLHLTLYGTSQDIHAVIHTHAPYATLWSCIIDPQSRDVVPAYTPYLDMKLGKVAGVRYHKPGSQALFDEMRLRAGSERGYLLQNHGPIVGGSSLMNAFEAIEELEQSAFLAWHLRTQQNLPSPSILSEMG